MSMAMDIPVLNDYTIITGGAPGVDAEAERQALHFGTRLDVVIGPHHPRRQTITPLTEEELNRADSYFITAQTRLGKGVSNAITAEYLKRNFHIAARAGSVYAFGFFTFNHKQMKGGTGWTVEYAKQLHRQIFAYDLEKSRWYKYNYGTGTFHAMGNGNFPLLHTQSAIVGSRYVDNYPRWKEALAGLFERTVGCLQSLH